MIEFIIVMCSVVNVALFILNSKVVEIKKGKKDDVRLSGSIFK